jgi:hypothetical protein
MGAYEELPGHHLRSTLDLVASAPVFEYRDSMETPDPEPCAIAFRRYNPRDHRPHMHPSYYYFGVLTLTPPMTAMIRLTNASTSIGLSHRTRRPRRPLKEGTPRRLKLSSLTHETKPSSSARPKELNLRRFKNCKPSSTRNKRTCACFTKPSSRSARHAHVAEGLDREPMVSIIASLRIGRANPKSSIEPARTSSPPPCFSAICLSHLPPRPVGPAMSLRSPRGCGPTAGYEFCLKARRGCIKAACGALPIGEGGLGSSRACATRGQGSFCP